MLPLKLNTSPTAPVPPEPVVIIETEKSFSVKEANVSLVPAVIVSSPFEDSVIIKCLLTEKFVSVIPEFAVVFKVLIVSYGNLNTEIFFCASCINDLLLIPVVLVDLAAVTLDNVKLVSDMIASIILVSVLPLSLVNEIESLTFNSLLNLVLIPITSAEPLAISIEPDKVTLLPFVLSNAVSAV